MSTLNTRCAAMFAIIMLIFVSTSVILLVYIEEETKPRSIQFNLMNYHSAQYDCKGKNSTLITHFNVTEFKQLVIYCKYKLKSNCWIGLKRTECKFNRTTLKYTDHGYWMWVDNTFYNKSYYENKETMFWCDMNYAVAGNSYSNAKYPRIAPHWDTVEHLSRYTDQSFCEAPFVYVDIKEECLKNGWDGADPRWGGNQSPYHKTGVCANDNYLDKPDPVESCKSNNGANTKNDTIWMFYHDWNMFCYICVDNASFYCSMHITRRWK
eukprot:87532_1